MMELLSLGEKAIDEERPSGVDVKYEPEFEELNEEIKKLGFSAEGSGGVNWKKVSDISAEILGKKSKNLLVASYLSVSRIHLDGLDGLYLGIKIYRDLIDNFWETLFPPKKRIKGRINAVEWWLEKTEDALREIDPPPQPAESVEAAKADLGRIEQSLDSSVDPALGQTVKRSLQSLARFLDGLPTEETSAPSDAEGTSAPSDYEETARSREPDSPKRPDPEPIVNHDQAGDPERPFTSGSPKQGRDASAAPTGTPPVITSPKEALSLVKAGLQQVRQGAGHLREEEPGAPHAYRLSRIACWGQIESSPPAVEGKTRIAPPNDQSRNAVERLRELQDWENLVKISEQNLSRHIYWLDLNRYTTEALEALGTDYRLCVDAVAQETGYLIHRLPRLRELVFSDGTPFANAETIQWLNDIAIGGSGATIQVADQPLTGGGEKKEGPSKAVLDRARSLVKEKKYVEAVELLQEGRRQSTSGKDSLMWRMALARMLIGGKRIRTVLPHLDRIVEDIETYSLRQWDPDLALQGFKIAWMGFSQCQDDGSQGKTERLLTFISELDPAESMRLIGET